MAAIVVLFKGCGSQVCSYFQSGSLLGLQLLHLAFVCAVRSFRDWENNVIEVFSEAVYTVLVAIVITLPYERGKGNNLIFGYRDKEKWMVYIVIYSSLVVCSFILLIMIIKVLGKQTQKFKVKIKAKDQTRNPPK